MTWSGIVSFVEVMLQCHSETICCPLAGNPTQAVDLYVLERAFISTHENADPLVNEVMRAYKVCASRDFVSTRMLARISCILRSRQARLPFVSLASCLASVGWINAENIHLLIVVHDTGG